MSKLDEKSVLDDMFNALSHNIRRQIILLIGSHGSASYTDLKILDLEPGTLYFHIDVLLKGESPLVKRSEDKQYRLTEIGRSAYDILEQGEDSFYWIEKRTSRGPTVLSILAMMPIIKRIQADPWRFWLDILLFLGGYGYLAHLVGLLPIGLFFIEGPFDLGVTILATLLAWVSTYLLVESISSIILGYRGFSPPLFMSLPIVFLPYIISGLVIHFLIVSQAISGWILTLFLVGAISWSSYILTIALARSRSVRPIRAGIVTLIVTNVNLILLTILT